jgi:hypothetical protein
MTTFSSFSPPYCAHGPHELPVFHFLAEHAFEFLHAKTLSMRGGNFLEDVVGSEANSSPNPPLSSSSPAPQQYYHLRHHHPPHPQQGLVTIEGVLVLMLYVSLITEIIAIARGRYWYNKRDNSERKATFLRTIKPGSVSYNK